MEQLLETPSSPSARGCIERRFTTHDGVQLFFRHWPATTQKRRGAVLLFHRGHEHSGRVAHLVDELDMPDFAFYAWDARGHGRSRVEDAPAHRFADCVRDIDEFVRVITLEDGVAIQDMAIVAQSVGAALAVAWAHDYAPDIRALSLASPAFDIKLYIPFAREFLSLFFKLRGDFFVNSYVKARFLTHDESRVASYESDPLITRPIPVRMLLGLYDAAGRIVRDAAAITIPTQLLVSGADWVVPRSIRSRPSQRCSPARRISLRGDGVPVSRALGFSRSAAAVAAWLIVTGRATCFEKASERIGAARPRVRLRGDCRAAILQAPQLIRLAELVKSPRPGREASDRVRGARALFARQAGATAGVALLARATLADAGFRR